MKDHKKHEMTEENHEEPQLRQASAFGWLP
jgi:hypothetical protein